MSSIASNKHANRSAQTRGLFIQAAQKLYGDRSIDAVSLNEITVAAGQKNRNALQYHFGNRDGLLQAIIDLHAGRIAEMRGRYLASLDMATCSEAEAAASALVMPLADYMGESPEAICYIKILSQLAALNSEIINPGSGSRLSFKTDTGFDTLVRRAVAHLRPVEAQRRIFLAVSITFHSLADICRASEISGTSRALKNRRAMCSQLELAVAALLAAPARE